MKIFNWTVTAIALILICTVVFLQIAEPWALIAVVMSLAWLISWAWGPEHAG
ncbi:MAG: hypothetical protein K6A77_11590 [Clostridiales bacterium]|nr:hypothetical protein [Clostridiales bacterium]